MPIGGSDYDPGPYNLIIPAGNTSLLFTVPLAIDSIVELEEEFELRIDRTTLAVLISTDPTRVVIMDNDSKYYHKHQEQGQGEVHISSPDFTHVYS